jgi:hypothetical protein
MYATSLPGPSIFTAKAFESFELECVIGKPMTIDVFALKAAGDATSIGWTPGISLPRCGE